MPAKRARRWPGESQKLRAFCAQEATLLAYSALDNVEYMRCVKRRFSTTDARPGWVAQLGDEHPKGGHSSTVCGREFFMAPSFEGDI
jgi:hypothetical protein